MHDGGPGILGGLKKPENHSEHHHHGHDHDHGGDQHHHHGSNRRYGKSLKTRVIAGLITIGLISAFILWQIM